ncbi:MFS transporter [Actinokineospora sp. HUAS TT18]|uniref:MFS transporter n=1 Tax=Actinokineospora sp. HUAS TT18 TaxID=3447451 RepID=UPI003F520195
MYVSTEPLRRGAARSAAKVPPTVLALGMVSLVTDISAEMVTAFLPMYLVYGLGAGYLQLGVVDGLYTGATALLRLLGGHFADRTGRPKAVAALGYGLSAVTKLGFPLAGGSMGAIGGLLAVDRAGKGIRTGPRDAMIALSSPPSALGRAFGVHRMMDTVGALLGPVAAFALVAWAAHDTVFVVSFGFAMVGLVILLVWVREPAGTPARRDIRVRDGVRLLADSGFRRICGYAVLLGLATVSDAFILVAVQQRTGIAPGWLPLLPLGIAVTFLGAAIPVGRLADRLGRWRVFLAGHVLLLAVYVLLAVGFGGLPLLFVALGLHGLFYAATDGVLMACAGPLLPDSMKASGLAVLQTGQALARTVAAVLFGVAAAGWGLGPSFAVFGGVLLVAVVFSRRSL